MKPFFGQQVIERPRRGSSNPSLKVKASGKINQDGEYEGITRIPMSRSVVDRYGHSKNSKDLTDLLGPITRYLHSKIGHRWNDVYSELVEGLGKGSYPIRHVLHDHIFNKSSYNGTYSPLSFYCRGGRFLCDDKGIVRFIKNTPYKSPQKNVRVVAYEDDTFFVEVKGIWYIGRYVIQDNYRYTDYSRYNSNPIEWPDYAEGYGPNRKIYRFKKIKQANKKELDKLKDTLTMPGVNDKISPPAFYKQIWL